MAIDKPFVGAMDYSSKKGGFSVTVYEIVYPTGNSAGIEVLEKTHENVQRALATFAKRFLVPEFGADFQQKITYELPDYVKNMTSPSDVAQEYDSAYRPLTETEREILEKEVKEALSSNEITD